MGNMLIRYKIRMTTRNVMSTLISIEDPLKHGDDAGKV
jgi:hypothetical protein